MKEQLSITKTFRIITLLLIFIGAGTFIFGLFADPKRTWANYLIVNYYFLSLATGGAFFLVIQSITQSGWSSAFKRIPEAMMTYIPFAALFFLLFYFGIREIYQWSEKEILATDKLIQHKSGYLNIPFFYLRLIIYFSLWVIFTRVLRKFSLREDSLDPGNRESIMALFGKTELYSKILIFIFAITFCLAAFDWLISIDAHWYSTIFAIKNIMASFLHGVSIMILIVFILYKRGYFSFLNKYHLHDFARYIFMLSIIWGYFWFAQFMIIWYGNLPDETVYFYTRWQSGWKAIFFLEIGLNWFIPFMVLLPVKTSRNMTFITVVIAFLVIGQYIDIFFQVIPGTTGLLQYGWIEAGLFIGFAGLFALVVATSLSRAKLIPRNHPYLEESTNHHFV